MFLSAIDSYDAPAMWWETDCVRYGLSYTPVRSRLTALMGTHVVRLTDRKYMLQLVLKLQEDYEAQQNARIERRKLKPTSIISELHTLPKSLLKSLLKKIPQQRRQCVPKFHAVAVKKCKQLPQLLSSDD